MRKMIVCSFDEVGVRMTAWNGIHPDRVGSYSMTVEMNRTQFNDACKNRHLFGEMLGINITEGWQNALSDAIKNASPLKVDFMAASKALVEKITERFVLEHGKEEGMKKAEAFFNSVDTETEDTEELIKKAMIAVAAPSDTQPASDDQPAGADASAEPESAAQPDETKESSEPETHAAPEVPQPTEGSENEGQGNAGKREEDSAKGSKKSRSKTSA